MLGTDTLLQLETGKAAFAGFAATVVMTALVYASPYFGFPEMDFAAMIASLFLDGAHPLPFTAWWWMGMGIHFIDGSVLFPFIYAGILYPIIPRTPVWNGMIFGIVLWLLSLVTAMPAMGAGFFCLRTEAPFLAVLGSLFGHLAYGTVLGWLSGRVKSIRSF